MFKYQYVLCLFWVNKRDNVYLFKSPDPIYSLLWKFVNLTYLSHYNQVDSGDSVSNFIFTIKCRPEGKRLSPLQINPKWLSQEDFPKPGEVHALD